MSKQLKSLDIVFENCESCNVPTECIQWFWIDGFKHILHFQSPNDVFDHYSANFVNLQLINLNRVSESGFGCEFIARIKQYTDVTQITLNYEDETHFNFCVPWGGEDNYTNKYQYMKIGKDPYTKQEVMYLAFSKEKPEDWDEEEE